MPRTVAADFDDLARFCAVVTSHVPALAACGAALHDQAPEVAGVVDEARRELDALAERVASSLRRLRAADADPSTAWVVDDAWQASQAVLRLSRLVAPGSRPLAALLARLPVLQAALAAVTRRAPTAVPLAGSVAGGVLTLADVRALAGNGNPIAALRADPLDELADTTQVGSDLLSAACATAPSAPTCAGTLALTASTAQLRLAHDTGVVVLPMPGLPLVVPVRQLGPAARELRRGADELRRDAATVEHRAEHLARRAVGAAGRRLHDAGELLHPLVPISW